MEASLPTLGVGVSLSLASEPDPLWLAQAVGGPAFVEYAGLADPLRIQTQTQRLRAAGIPLLFHPSYLNFCGSFANESHWLAQTAAHVQAVASPWFAQDCAYCFWSAGQGYSTQFGYFVPPVFNEASLQLAIARVREVQAAMPVPVAIEPPPLTFVVGNMPLCEFFGRLATATGCLLLLDMGHLVSYELASGRSLRAEWHALPWQQVVEVHIAGGRLQEGAQGPLYLDAHECPVLPSSWALLQDILPLLPELRAVCYECEGIEGKEVLATLQRLRALVVAGTAHAALRAKVEAQS